ncbi:MAG: phosphoribosylamine--glycine ligase [Kouleothrix sp.]|nr:phosphoribosylamine--glycine ligase [Kouleothrix sp.]
MKKVLLVDHSGRGHAFADLLSRTNKDVLVYYAPGCSAITTERVVTMPHLKLSEPLALADFARAEAVDFVLVTNAGALGNGVVDVFRSCQIPVIGPDKQAAKLEWSKTYGKQLCAKYNVPTAEFALFDNPDDAMNYVREVGYQVVVKADGLCDGNGSFVCDSVDDAIKAIDYIMIQRAFGEAGDRVVVEQRLFGTELLFFALLDSKSFKLLPSAFDYSRSDDNDRGVICGGMGSISPHPLETEVLNQQMIAQVLNPLLECIRGEQLNFTGVIYIGCMLVGEKLHVLEINARMGDPEAESILPRIESDFVAVCESILNQTLEDQSIILNDYYFCNIVATQGRTRQISNGKNKGWYQGWPYGRYGRSYKITGVDHVDPRQCKVFIGQATVHPEKGLVTDGGRPIHVSGFGKSVAEASANAYANISKIHFEGIRYRSDIGKLLPHGKVSES